MNEGNTNFKYDIAISFANEDRVIVEEYVKNLKDKKVRVFYDNDESHILWGKNLYQYLSEVFLKEARYCVVFISANYINKPWTIHELSNAQSREFQQLKEYILPVKLDESVIPGILSTKGFLDIKEKNIDQIVQITIDKLGSIIKKNSFLFKPEITNILKKYLSDSPVYEPSKIIELMKKELAHSNAWWKSSEYKRIMLIPVKAPICENIECINLNSIVSCVYLKISNIVQFDELFSYELNYKPSEISYNSLINEMKSFSPESFTKKIHPLSQYHVDQPIPNSYNKKLCKQCHGTTFVSLQCKSCNGFGFSLNENNQKEICNDCKGKKRIDCKCELCVDGYTESHIRRIRNVYKQEELLYQKIMKNEKVQINIFPNNGLDIIGWYDIIKDSNELPFTCSLIPDKELKSIGKRIKDISQSVNYKLSNEITCVVDIENLKKKVRKFYDDNLNNTDNYVYIDNFKTINSKVNHNIMIIQVCPIYKISYSRELVFETGFFSKKTKKAFFEGEILMNNYGVYQHNEITKEIIEVPK